MQILLGFTKIESTVRYLGVDVEETPALAEGSEMQQRAELAVRRISTRHDKTGESFRAMIYLASSALALR